MSGSNVLAYRKWHTTDSMAKRAKNDFPNIHFIFWEVVHQWRHSLRVRGVNNFVTRIHKLLKSLTRRSQNIQTPLHYRIWWALININGRFHIWRHKIIVPFPNLRDVNYEWLSCEKKVQKILREELMKVSITKDLVKAVLIDLDFRSFTFKVVEYVSPPNQIALICNWEVNSRF